MVKRRLRWSLCAFALTFLIFNLNGHIVAHMVVGHSMWKGYFLLPFFVLGLLGLPDGDRDRRSRMVLLTIPLTVFAMLLQGSVHIVVWCLLFLLIIAILHAQLRRPAFLVIIASLLTGAGRILPAALVYLGRRHGDNKAGFASARDLFDALTDLRSHISHAVSGLPTGWWEYDTYIGVAGLIFLLWYGANLTKRTSLVRYRVLLTPSVVLLVLSIGYWAGPLALVPVLGFERVPSRFAILPVLALSVLASSRLDASLTRSKCNVRNRALVAFGILWVGMELLRHSSV